MNLNNLYQVYYKNPSQFILNNWSRLLPEWSVGPQTVIIILIKSQFFLEVEEEKITQEKERLLKEFYNLANLFIEQRIATEIISPVDGRPQSSRAGDLTFDVVEVIHQLLGYDFSRTPDGCKFLKHPIWHSAVYPGILLSIDIINNH